MKENKVSIVVQAIDRATAPIRAINERIARIAAPARAATRAMQGMVNESRFKQVAAAVGDVRTRFNHLRQAIGGVVRAGLVATGVLGGMFYAIKRVADGGDEAVKASQRYGTTIKDWQRLSYAADLANVSTMDLGNSLKYLNKNAVAAATGNAGMATWFQRAGISVTDMNGKMKPSRQLLEELADRFASMPDGAKKTALAVGLLGDSGEKMIPLLNGGAKALRAAGKEAEALGLVDEKLAKDGEAFNNTLARTRAAVRGLSNAVASAFLPALDRVLPKLKGWVIANRALVASRASEFVAGLEAALPQLASGLGFVFDGVSQVATAVNAVVQFFGGWGTVMAAIGGLIAGKVIWSIVMLTKSIARLGLVTALTPFGLFMVAMAGIVALIYVFRNSLRPLGDAIAQTFSAFGGMLGEVFAAFKELVMLLAPVLVPLLKLLAKVVVGVLASAFQVVLIPIKLLIEHTTIVIGLITKALSFAGKLVGFGDTVKTPTLGAVAPSAIAAASENRRGGKLGGKLTVELIGAPARVRKMETEDDFDLDVETGMAMSMP